MTRQVIYRVEAEGKGIYASRILSDILEQTIGYDCGGRHPSLWEDMGFHLFGHSLSSVEEHLGCTHSDSRFGFAGWKQLDRWFTKAERALLAKHGAKLVRLHVKPEGVVVGDRQAVFDSRKVTSRRELSLKHARPPRKPVNAR